MAGARVQPRGRGRRESQSPETGGSPQPGHVLPKTPGAQPRPRELRQGPETLTAANPTHPYSPTYVVVTMSFIVVRI